MLVYLWILIYCLGTLPKDALLGEEGYMPVPDENDKITVIASLNEDAPIFNVKLIVRNALIGEEVVIVVKNQTDDVVSSTEVTMF